MSLWCGAVRLGRVCRSLLFLGYLALSMEKQNKPQKTLCAQLSSCAVIAMVGKLVARDSMMVEEAEELLLL